MSFEYLANISELTGINLIFLAIIIIWTMIWKGFALWKAGRKNQPIWFIILLIVNTIGILEILYIFIFSELKEKRNPKKKKRK